MTGYERFENDLTNLINQHSMESPSNTPDYILAMYLVACLKAYEVATQLNGDWHSNKEA